MKKILMAVIILIIAFSSCCFAADNNSVKSGILSYLGTTESEFQIALDDLRKSVAPLIPTDDSHLEEWEDYDMFEGFLSSLVKNRRIVKFYDSLLSMQMALRSSMIDEIVLPEAVVMYIVNNNPTQYEILFSLNMMPSTISFGFKKGNVELQKEFNSAISAMRKDGTLMSLEEKYINQLGASEPAKAKFQEFKGAKTIKVAVTGDLPPIDFIAADGTPTGYNTAILSEIGKRIKKNIRLISVESGGRSAALASERVDVVFWYRNRDGLKVPKKLQDKNLKGAMKDAVDGVILSEPYYTWDTDLVVGKAQ